MDNITRGAVFLAVLKDSLGSEQRGYRPVLVVQNDIGNKYSPTTVIIPISSKNKIQLPTHINLYEYNFLDYNSVALVEQIRVIDKTRLVKCLGKLSDADIKKIELSLMIELSINHKINNMSNVKIY